MTDTLTQRARDVAGRLKAILNPGFTMKRVSEGHYRGTNNIYRNPDGPEAAAIISELVERIEGVWQDIETAPRDRDVLLFAAETGEQFAAFYGTAMEDGDKQWVFARGKDIAFIVRNPTHWMPLPPPPSVLGKQEGEG